MTGRPPVLLLHGQPGGAGDWSRVIAHLNGRVDPIAIDRPGWDGRSRALGLAGNVRAALAALDARGAQRAVVAGHSLGAAIAAWLAARHPDRVTALVLAAPAANLASLSPVDHWLAAPVAGEVAGAAAMGGLALGLSVPQLRRRIAAAVGIEADYLQAARRVLLTPAAWRAYATEQRALIAELPALEGLLAEIAAPTTILVGAEDRIVSPTASRSLAIQIPGAELVVRPGSGHLLPQRNPEFVAQAIVDAVERWPGSNPGRRG